MQKTRAMCANNDDNQQCQGNDVVQSVGHGGIEFMYDLMDKVNACDHVGIPDVPMADNEVLRNAFKKCGVKMKDEE